jgi:TM2 domain-containing membrane protein YozV
MPETSTKTPIEKKNPIIAAIASFFIPGLGQIYNQDVRKGIVFIIIAIIFASTWLFLTTQHHMIGPILVAGGAYVLLWIGSMYDAYKTAKEFNSQTQ